jgi:hypothetical protein
LPDKLVDHSLLDGIALGLAKLDGRHITGFIELAYIRAQGGAHGIGRRNGASFDFAGAVKPTFTPLIIDAGLLRTINQLERN